MSRGHRRELGGVGSPDRGRLARIERCVLYRSLMAENRSCSRTGCNRPAAASLSFRYETRQVWVTSLQARSGTRYDLCAEHADTLTVPRGWHRKEERPRSPRRTPQPAAPPPVEADPRVEGVAEGEAPAAGERVATRTAPHVPADRYARLLSELPGVAAQTPPRAAANPGAQLAIPVNDRPAPDAVVVSLSELAGARRRSARETLRH